MIGFFRRLASAVRRFFSRRAARKLALLALPRGLPVGPVPPLRLSLRTPPPFEPPPGELWTLPLGAQAIRGRAPARLLRLAALPAVVRPLGVLREPRAIEPPPAPRLPVQLALVAPLQSRVRPLGVARPALFRLDEALLLPGEREPLRLSSDAPPLPKPRRVRPRTPLARAPLSRVDVRAFRLDRRTFAGPNEDGPGFQERIQKFWWISPKLKREKVDMPWMAQERIRFVGPLHYEWFVLWWQTLDKTRPGARETVPYELPRELDWAMEEIKEQMLIRRDVPKDEQPPQQQEFFYLELGPAFASHEGTDLDELIPEPAWVDTAQMLPPLALDRAVREAYLQWRTLMDGLQER